MSKACFHHGIFTPRALHRSARRLDRRVANVSTALAAMRKGESLHLQYSAGRPLWSLSGGSGVSAEVAAILTKSTSVVAVGDSLFAGEPGQTWRFVP